MKLTFRVVDQERGGRIRVRFGRLVKGALVVLLSLAGQASDRYSCAPIEPQEPVRCLAHEDCADGQHCDGVRECFWEVSCPPAAPATCVPGPPPRPAECWSDSQCAADERCLGSCLPPTCFSILPMGPGACYPVIGCETAADCPEGDVCPAVPGLEPYCFPDPPLPGRSAAPAEGEEAPSDGWRGLAEAAARRTSG